MEGIRLLLVEICEYTRKCFKTLWEGLHRVLGNTLPKVLREFSCLTISTISQRKRIVTSSRDQSFTESTVHLSLFRPQTNISLCNCHINFPTHQRQTIRENLVNWAVDGDKFILNHLKNKLPNHCCFKLYIIFFRNCEQYSVEINGLTS